MITGGAFTVRLNGVVALPAALLAWSVNANAPAVEGVPLRIPVEEPNVSPAGSAPLDTVQVMGAVPVAVSVCE